MIVIMDNERKYIILCTKSQIAFIWKKSKWGIIELRIEGEGMNTRGCCDGNERLGFRERVGRTQGKKNCI